MKLFFLFTFVIASIQLFGQNEMFHGGFADGFAQRDLVNLTIGL